MKLIIDIPQDELHMYAISCNLGMGNTAMERILNGTPLESACGVWTIAGPKGYAPGYLYRCSNCQHTQGYGVTAYCPHCGARMKEVE